MSDLLSEGQNGYKGPKPQKRKMAKGDKMVKMMYFLVNMVDSSFETSHSASNSTDKGRAMLDRSEIDGDGEQL